MDQFNFDSLNQTDGEHGNAHDHQDSNGSGDTAPALEAHPIDTVEVASTTSSKKHEKHGKKHHDEPAPVPAAVDLDDVDLSTPLAPTHDENKGFMRFMPALVKQMNAKGVPFTLDGNTGIITIDGFYKNGPMTLEVEANDDIVSIDKRAKRKVMKSYDDLVALNYKWWRASIGRGVNTTPDRPWLDAFLEKGLIKRVVIFVPRDEQATGDED